MQIERGKDLIRLTGADHFEPEDIFNCGQCFRWNRQRGGGFFGVAHGRAVRVFRKGEDILISGDVGDYTLWHEYFDLGLDYAAVIEKISLDEYTAEAARFAPGMRILRQDKWEALASFILSQCNNMARIKGIIERLCRLCGAPFDFEGRTLYAFPSPEAVAGLTIIELREIGCGYRAPYLLEAAREVGAGRLNLAELGTLSYELACGRLMALPGVGKKVADCVLLFGLHFLDSFPVDTWIKKALARHYPPSFDPSVFSPFAGIAQQYIFHYIRSAERDGSKKAV